MIFADRLQVTAIAGVADQRLVALGELALQRGEDRGTHWRRPSPPLDGCGRRCSAAQPASPSWPRRRSPCRVAASPAVRMARDRRAQARAQACRCARARPGYTAAARLELGQVSALIMPRSATTHTRAMSKRRRNRSITGIRVVTSAVLPGHSSNACGASVSPRRGLGSARTSADVGQSVGQRARVGLDAGQRTVARDAQCRPWYAAVAPLVGPVWNLSLSVAGGKMARYGPAYTCASSAASAPAIRPSYRQEASHKYENMTRVVYGRHHIIYLSG